MLEGLKTLIAFSVMYCLKWKTKTKCHIVHTPGLSEMGQYMEFKI